ncbi:amine oxidase catalytic domain-containing protein [Colletotrichum caudatum]|nr:amine oxidase catalytic domain-containing protein [Colletotrichum caudatum]
MVQKEIENLGLPEDLTVVVEPWAYDTDGMKDMRDRWTMAWFYMSLSDNPDANYYVYPLNICAEVSNSLEVVKIYRLPSGEHEKTRNMSKEFDRTKFHSGSEYHPDPVEERRTTTRTYNITQPEDPSKGVTLHDVRFGGRRLFYRLSLAEMLVPYGDLRFPYPRKAAFDLGNDGAGVNANNLKLGCDRLGHIKYFDGWLSTSAGEPLKMPKVICCHEIEDSILWRHTNFHLHIFCLRIDPAIDGHRNSFMVEETHPIPFTEELNSYNPLGVGFVTKSEIINKEVGMDLSDFITNRTFKMVSESVINSKTGTPVGFKLLPHYSQLLLAHHSSWDGKRAEEFTIQSTGGDGIASWIKQRERDGESGVRNEDIEVRHTFSSTHNPRSEDWPIVPCEKIVVGLKPFNVFERSPALDVPISSQEQNRSVLVSSECQDE